MTNATFLNRLQQVSALNRDFAERFVSNDLPRSFRYLPRLNQSFDGNPLKPGEHVFPHDIDPVVPLTADEVAHLLCRENRVPEWIDISVERADSEHTYSSYFAAGASPTTRLCSITETPTLRRLAARAPRSSTLVRGAWPFRSSLQTRMSSEPTSPNPYERCQARERGIF